MSLFIQNLKKDSLLQYNLIIYQNPKLGCSVTVFQVNDVHYTSKRSDIKIMDRLNVSTKMNQNYGRSFLQLPFHWPHRIRNWKLVLYGNQ